MSDEKGESCLKITEDSFDLNISNVDWIIKEFTEQGIIYHVGECKVVGGFVVAAIEDPEFSLSLSRHLNFDELLEGRAGKVVYDYPRRLLRTLCHERGISEYKGHPVDQYFKDEDWMNESSIHGKRPRKAL